MLNIKEVKGKKYQDVLIDNSLTFSSLVLEHAKVALVPGAAFGVDDFVRISYAASREKIMEGMDRLAKF